MPGAQVIELVISWLVTNALTFAVVLVDERRLSEKCLARAWPPASRDAAIVGFGLLALPIHFAKTRSAHGIVGRLLGLVAGVIVAILVALASGLLITAIAWVLGLPDVD